MEEILVAKHPAVNFASRKSKDLLMVNSDIVTQ